MKRTEERVVCYPFEKEAKKKKVDSLTSFSPSTLEEDQNNLQTPTSSKSKSTISSSNAGALASKLTVDNLKDFGINTDTYNTKITYHNVDAVVSQSIFQNPKLFSTFLRNINNRSVEKVGEDVSCSPLNNLLFLNSYFDGVVTSNKKQTISLKGNGSHSKDNAGTVVSKIELGKDDNFNLILYYISQILLNKLKPDLFLEQNLNNIFTNEELEKFGFSFLELFRIEAKESANDFSKDFLKILMLAMRECIQIMQILFEETGYIYPIRAPSLGNAGNLYRLSLTCILPPSLIFYLQYKENRNSVEFLSIEISNILSSMSERQKKLKSCEQETEDMKDETEELKEKEEKIKRDKKDLETLSNKISYLEGFFPEFLRGEAISIENSVFCFELRKFTFKDDIRCFQVKSDIDMKKLIYDCLVTCKYILKLVEMMKEELKLTLSCTVDENPFKDVTLPEMNWFNYRFKQISKNERSSVYMVQIKTKEGWFDHEIVKKYKDKYAYNMEQKFNSLIQNKSPMFQSNNSLVMAIASPSSVNSNNDLLNWLRLTALALEPVHKDMYIHGDIKPEHILMKDEKICLIDFEFSVRKGSSIIGCTKGFHPPEYDSFPESKIEASTAADIYAVALSALYLLFTCNENSEKVDDVISTSIEEMKEQIDESNLETKHVEMIDCKDEMVNFSNNNSITATQNINEKRDKLAKMVDNLGDEKLKSLLEKMLKTNPEERIKNATDLLQELNKIEPVQLNPANNITNTN